MLLNNPLVVEQSRRFARRLREGRAENVGLQIGEAWRLALSREPTDAERSDAEKFLAERTDYFRSLPKSAPAPRPSSAPPARRNAIARPADVDPPAVTLEEPEFEALALLCQALVSSNEFLYVD
jgi:hypothetical protein